MSEEVTALAETLAASDPAAWDRPSADGDGPSLEGADLDHFRLGACIGRGGMGEVYEAEDLSLGRPVAIKVLRGEVTEAEGMAERFLREARAQARLNHPNIVHIYYIGRRPMPTGGVSLFFAMERLHGGDLDELLKAGDVMPPEDARQAMIQVARALRAARRASLIHRDIKPSNLMVTEDGVVKLADFGLAKPMDGDNKITQEGALVGSPYYIAPEQAVGDDLDHRCDMYALGASFYHLLTGQPPFDGPRPMAVVAKHLSEPLEPVRSVAPYVPKPLASVVERLLEKKPDKRYADYDELIAELEKAAPQRRALAPITTRAMAVMLDFVVAGVLIGLLRWVGLIVYLAIVTAGHAWRGQTPAKYLLGIEVRRDDGHRLGFWRSLARTLLSLWMPILAGAIIALSSGIPELLAVIEGFKPSSFDQLQNFLVATAMSHGALTLLYFVGLGLALFSPQRKTVHDMIVRTRVTYRIKARDVTTPASTSGVDASTAELGAIAKKLNTRPPPPMSEDDVNGPTLPGG